MKRAFDLALVAFLGILLLVPFLVICVCVFVTSGLPILHWSDRVGRNNELFSMPKIRSMKVGTPPVASHLLPNPATYLTPLGYALRKTSLDELPQLWSILIGHMSFVGPRPALFNQDDLIDMRTRAGVHKLQPGLTGLAQINGRDDLLVPEKVALDAEYMRKQSLRLDCGILWATVIKVVRRDGISH